MASLLSDVMPDDKTHLFWKIMDPFTITGTWECFGCFPVSTRLKPLLSEVQPSGNSSPFSCAAPALGFSLCSCRLLSPRVGEDTPGCISEGGEIR